MARNKIIDFNLLVNPSKFFSEWADDKKFNGLVSISCLFMALLLSWVAVNIKGLEIPALIYAGFITYHLVLFSVDFLNEKTNISGHVCMGKNPKIAFIAMFIGLIIGVVFLITGSLSFFNPLASIQITDKFGAFLFIVLIAPFVEEVLFRMAVYPTIIAMVKPYSGVILAGLLSIFLTSFMFAFFHYAVFNASLTAMLSAFTFSIIAIVGNRLFSSAGFGVGLHYSVNFLVFALTYGLAGLF